MSRVGVAVLAAALALVATACGSSGTARNGLDQVPTKHAASKPTTGLAPGPLSPSLMDCPWKECARQTALVAAGAKLKVVPPDVFPPLSEAYIDIELQQDFAGCATFDQPASPACLMPGPSPSSPRLVVFGDSQAEMWGNAFGILAKKLGYSMLLLSEPGCPAPDMPFWDNQTNAPATACAQWRSAAIDRINKFAPNIVIVATIDFLPLDEHNRAISQDEFSAGLVKTLHEISAPGRKLVVMGDIPYWPQSGPICLGAHLKNISACTARAYEAVFAANDQALHAAAEKAGARYVNVIPWFCTRLVCPQVIQNTVVYVAYFHITSTYAKRVLPLLQTAVGLDPT